jgi:hypothetical protein
VSILLYADLIYSQAKYAFSVSNAQRMAYASSIIIGRKFTDAFSLEICPTWVHYNLAPYGVNNDQIALGIGLRQKITNRTSINVEYIPLFGASGVYTSSLSVGCDIETGGHVFQLHLTNSIGMVDPQYIGRTENKWQNGGIRFGFNISRVFTIVDPSRFGAN